jgi:nucleotide-binding universal stress UspA family protein
MTRVLIATDGSPTSRAATVYAADLLGCANVVAISVLTVVRPPLDSLVDMDSLFIPQNTWDELESAAREAADMALQAAVADLARFDGLLKTVCRTGHQVPRVIVDTARELGADLIVMGASRHTALSPLLGGRVSDWVQQHAPCPVLLVRAR